MTQSEETSAIWNYYKPRHTHAWNMLILAFRQLEQEEISAEPFKAEYAWENVIIRLWLYRTVIRTLSKLPPIKEEAEKVLRSFDKAFDHRGINGLKALRDMIEHFDDYAANKGRGPAKRASDLNPWRKITRDEYDRGQFNINREKALLAADQMRLDAKQVSAKFIKWYLAQ